MNWAFESLKKFSTFWLASVLVETEAVRILAAAYYTI